MEYQIDVTGETPDLAAIQDRLHALDPAALLAIDGQGRTLKVAGALDALAVLGVLRESGLVVRADAFRQLPSVCCGGCGG